MTSEAHAAPVFVSRLSLADFRCYAAAELTLEPGITVIAGANAQGKTSLLEAIAWAARGKSFRNVADSALVRLGAEQAIVRLDVVDGARTQTFEAEVRLHGRNRVRINRQSVTRARDLVDFLRVTVFAPDDLRVVKDGPALRREYLDELLVMNAPRYEAVCRDYERVLKQRNALLRGGVRGADAERTLDVFDEQLVRTGSELVRGRARLIVRLEPEVRRAYEELAGATAHVATLYDASWLEEPVTELVAAGELEESFARALASRRRAETDRGATLVGPHRDEWRLLVSGLDSRTHASQGEQRTLALALRLGGHALTESLTRTAPVMLLDDVFSELDEQRAAALTEHLRSGQTLVTTAGGVPTAVRADRAYRVTSGRVAVAA